jgi:regulator of RNase E activity RraA
MSADDRASKPPPTLRPVAPSRWLEAAELDAWRAVPSAVISDERNHQGVLASIRPLFAGRSFAGQAITMEITAAAQGTARQALGGAWPGACIVIDARTSPDAAVWGGNLIRLARGRGVAAVVVDGSVRDVAELRDSGIAVCSRGVTPRGPGWTARIGGTIHCGGVAISAGDLIVGDDDGVIAVPIADADETLLARCQDHHARDLRGHDE